MEILIQVYGDGSFSFVDNNTMILNAVINYGFALFWVRQDHHVETMRGQAPSLSGPEPLEHTNQWHHHLYSVDQNLGNTLNSDITTSTQWNRTLRTH